MAKVRVGDKAPDFSLQGQDGQLVRLSELLAHGSVVAYFYPKDRTPGCTAEAGAFRNSHLRFGELGAQVVGISSDSVESHEGFARECDLPFKILSDVDGRVRKSYGVRSSMGIIPGRVTFVIDRHGTVRRVFSSQLRATRHVDEALKVLGELEDEVAAQSR